MKNVKYGNILEKAVDGIPSLVIPLQTENVPLSKSEKHLVLNHTFNTFAETKGGLLIKMSVIQPNPGYIEKAQTTIVASS